MIVRILKPTLRLNAYFVALAIWLVTSASFAQNSQNRYNIIVIIADDLGWHDVGYINGEVDTPAINSLAASSLIFDRFYVKMACTPTRAALATGRHPYRYGLSASVIKPWDKAHLPLDELTLSELLKADGFTTALVGKWHLGHYAEAYLPQARGFDYHYGNYCGSVDYNSHEIIERNLGGLDWHRNGKVVEEKGYATQLLGKDARNFVRNHARQAEPYFLQLAFTAPHLPLQLPGESLSDITERVGDEAREALIEQVRLMDQEIGMLIDTLKSTDQMQRTIIWFLSDNGAEVYLGDFGGGSNGPLRGGKGSLYEGGIRVPSFLYVPLSPLNGTRTSTPFSVVDILPTLAALSHTIIPKGVSPDGQNIFETLSAPHKPPREFTLLQAPYGSDLRFAALWKNWKLVSNGGYIHDTTNRLKPLELYDLSSDPNETYNQAPDRSALAKKIHSLVERHLTDHPPTVPHHAHSRPPRFWRAPRVWSPSALHRTNSRFRIWLRSAPRKHPILTLLIACTTLFLLARITQLVLPPKHRRSSLKIPG